jgi:hypothetical protein
MATLIQRENGTFYTQFFDATRTPSKKRVNRPGIAGGSIP